VPEARLLLFGPGYVGAAVARAAGNAGFAVTGVTRATFADADEALVRATHLLSTVPPDAAGDPVLARHAD